MKTTIPAALAAFLISIPCLADGLPEPSKVEASFDGARLADDLSGSVGDPAKETRVRVFATKGSKVSATLSPDLAAGASTQTTLALCDDAGAPVDVAPYDKSKPGTDTIVWKNVPLDATDGYSFIVRGTGTGFWRLRLAGRLAASRQSFASTANLEVGTETQVGFVGLRGGSLTFGLAPTAQSQFRGALVRIDRPDGSTLDGSTTLLAAKGKVKLDADGTHHLVFKNVGAGLGGWSVKTTVSPPKLSSRRGYVRPEGTALVPVVTKVTPSKDYHRDDAASVTVMGRDFQPGADVRLVREGFADIVGTNVSVDSETQIRLNLDLATGPVTGRDSVGIWRVGVWNAPVYTVPGDLTTLQHDSATRDVKKTFSCVAAASITLPPGAVKGAEMWQLVFNEDFQADLNLMGLGSNDAKTANLAKNMVESYVVCFLRDLFKCNVTNGALVKNVSPAVSFVIGKMPSAAGKPGVAYDRIEIGGAWQSGDPTDPTEPLLWGFAPVDPLTPGAPHLEDLSVSVSDGSGGTTRLGYGVRTRVLDPGAGTANPNWTTAMQPLLTTPLAASDARYFSQNYAPTTAADANRYSIIVNQVTRASREIAAIVAHQIGRSMGLAPGGSGPMANPGTAGYFWPTTTGLVFNPADLAALAAASSAVPPPGKSKTLVVKYFPFISTQVSILPDSRAAVPYSVNWNYVGGRANAVPADYKVVVSGGSQSGTPFLSGLVPSYTGLAGTMPLWFNQQANQFNCGIAIFRISTSDKVLGTSVDFFYRLKVFANVALLPVALQTSATICNNTLLSTP